MASDKEFEDYFFNVHDEYEELNIYILSAKMVAKDAWDHQQSKLEVKDELLRELVKQLNKDVGDMNCIELNKWYAENDKLLNKPEIKRIKR